MTIRAKGVRVKSLAQADFWKLGPLFVLGPQKHALHGPEKIGGSEDDAGSGSNGDYFVLLEGTNQHQCFADEAGIVPAAPGQQKKAKPV